MEILLVSFVGQGDRRYIDLPKKSIRVDDKKTKLKDMVKNSGLPCDGEISVTVPEFFLVYNDLDRAVGDYDIRDGDVVYITQKIQSGLFAGG